MVSLSTTRHVVTGKPDSTKIHVDLVALMHLLTSLGFSRSPRDACCRAPALLGFAAGSGGAEANARSDCECDPTPRDPQFQPEPAAPQNLDGDGWCPDRKSSAFVAPRAELD